MVPMVFESEAQECIFRALIPAQPFGFNQPWLGSKRGGAVIYQRTKIIRIKSRLASLTRPYVTSLIIWSTLRTTPNNVFYSD
ncbi:hypothetical protein DTO027I6_8137 [Penicillium roqueforti]|nr:hypothetical protein CBS147337_6234 [Penicillium roqueforti]KAI2675971.1 hypothetical protein CBS147355_6152 [Penicillium roqueforti]KAI2679342.1 hypothetical protein LCP963914a_7441 [Penicillium roqueforti]KAI2707644.1 hypothetical protein CBS147332_6702 [Penicillium roqueforti]KAI3112216.1 hypothetical protein CBS147331_4770 [Penicillium roqueforti]